ncbi:MAG: M24 family metallopeptidase [Actinomycetota bacterium]|nr:M24 family metallopeptidase [Actinomycetota bacterium]
MKHRLDALREHFDGWSLLVDRSDVRWASGFTGSHGWLVVGPSSATLVTDGRYTERAQLETGDCDIRVVTAGTPSEVRAAVAKLVGQERVGCRASVLSHDQWASLAEEGVVLVHHDATDLRRVKEEHEIATIKRAAEIATEALTLTLPLVDVGVTERDIRDELDHRMRRLGADGPSYDTIVASGPVHSAIPHHLPSNRSLSAGDSLVVDVGALVDGYHSDMTRTFFVGEPPSPLVDWYRVLLEAQQKGLTAVRVGASARDIDQVCRTSLGDSAEFFVHGTGHGVGLDIHEQPFLNRSAEASLADGEVVTVEPGLYRRGLGGIRIEDLVVVRGDAAEILTQFPKELTCLPSPPMI